VAGVWVAVVVGLTAASVVTEALDVMAVRTAGASVVVVGLGLGLVVVVMVAAAIEVGSVAWTA